MKNILKVTFVIIGTLIGAGFASGQEMYIFFYSYGINGIFGLAISSLLIGAIIYKTLNIIEKYDVSNYKDFIDVIVNKNFEHKFLNFKNISSIIINIFILITFFIMIAGFGAYFEQVLGFNHFIGSAILAFLCFIVFQKSVSGLVKISEFLIPILIFLIILVGILNLSQLDFPGFIKNITQNSKSGWLINCILYSSYNCIILVPSIITLKNYITSKRSNFGIGLFTTLIVVVISAILFCILGNVDVDISSLEMPVVYVVGNSFKWLKYVYGFVIVASIFTTSISLGTSFLQNVVNNKESYPHFAGIMCITSVVISNFGFSNLVNLLYPIFGYLGLVQILGIFKN